MIALRVLVCCEFSGVVRDAFAALGHDAWSCDLLPSETPGQHIQGDALGAVRRGGWDLMIAHPPCTYLCNSGVRWLVPGGVPDSARWGKMLTACRFFAALWHSDCPRMCIENPVMHGQARRELELLGVPAFTQSIQPWQHGHDETKRTCLWLRGLPALVPSKVVPPDFDLHPVREQTNSKTGLVVQRRGSGYKARVHHASPGPDRWKERSRTLTGIAKAMADQFTKDLQSAQWGGAL